MMDVQESQKNDESNKNTSSDAFARLSRMQFKTNTLLETQAHQMNDVLAILKDLQSRSFQSNHAENAKTDLLLSLLPVLDGLRIAIESGHAVLLLKQSESQHRSKLHAWFPFLFPSDSDRIGKQLSAWINGLELIQERFLSVLESEGINPTAFVDQSFDPHKHIAVEVLSQGAFPQDSKNNGIPVIKRVLSQGYCRLALSGRSDEWVVLRYAEVAVVK